MADVALVARLVEAHYEAPVAVSPLHHFAHDARGVYRVQDAAGGSGVLRMSRDPEAATALGAQAALLRWLESRAYPAPRVCLTLTGRALAEYDGWRALLLTFIAGDPVEPAPRILRPLAARAGRLHRLSSGTAGDACPPPGDSRKHPARVAPAALSRLAAARERLPAELDHLCDGLGAALHGMDTRTDLPQTLIHGDCWHQNAVRTESEAVTLIDWDSAGRGPAVFDFAYLLFTCHYDLAQPTRLRPDADRIRAVVEAYCQERAPTAAERDALLDAMRFSLFPGVDHLAALGGGQWREDGVIQKLQARFAVTEEIAALAQTCLDGLTRGTIR